MGILIEGAPIRNNKTTLKYSEFIDCLADNVVREPAIIEGQGVEDFDDELGEMIMNTEGFQKLYKAL